MGKACSYALSAEKEYRGRRDMVEYKVVELLLTDLEFTLGGLGKERWELIQALEFGDGAIYGIFKRRLLPKPLGTRI